LAWGRPFPVQRILARLAVRPPELDGFIVVKGCHICFKVVPNVFKMVKHLVGRLMVVYHKVPHVCLVHLLANFVPSVVVKLSILGVHLRLEFAEPCIPCRRLSLALCGHTVYLLAAILRAKDGPKNSAGSCAT